ncbi:MAG TPA: response regulator, partial [Candidatus Synoicihabitans sp.]|nr:response regulator [Candidatus Synoicihabitans sp.]
LRAIIEAAAAQVSGKTEDRSSLDIACEEDLPTLEADPTRLQQALAQLITLTSRAASAAPVTVSCSGSFDLERSEIVIRAALRPVASAGARAAASPGRATPEQTVSTLTYLVAERLISEHGGVLEALPTEEEDATGFRITLPWRGADSADPSLTEPPALDLREMDTQPLAGVHVLLVEDSRDSRNALTIMLRHAGADVTSVESSSAAIAAYRTRKPDLIVSDLGLPKMDGYELLQQFRQWERRARSPLTPALALTGYDGERIRRRALAIGYRACLCKPVEPEDLVRALVQLRPATGGN